MRKKCSFGLGFLINASNCLYSPDVVPATKREILSASEHFSQICYSCLGARNASPGMAVAGRRCGWSFGGHRQAGDDPRAHAIPWSQAGSWIDGHN